MLGARFHFAHQPWTTSCKYIRKKLLILQINWHFYMVPTISAWLHSYEMVITSFQLYSWYIQIHPMYFALCISLAVFSSLSPWESHYLCRSFSFSFFLSLLHSHFHWNVHSICRSFYSLHCVHIRYVMYNDVHHMHIICLCLIKIVTERIDAYVRDAFQFNHTWNVTHDRNVV